MSRPRIATKILDARGAFRKDPQRARPNEPKPAKGTFRRAPPKQFSPKEKSCWKEIVRSAPEGVLTKSDEIMVEIAASLLNEFRTDRSNISMTKIARLQTILTRLGFDPSGRASISVNNGKEESEF